MKRVSNNTKIQQLYPAHVETARMQSGESGINLDDSGRLKIVSSVTLQDIEEFCTVNKALSEGTKHDILSHHIMYHLHSLTTTPDQKDVYRNIMRFIYKKGFNFNKKYFPGHYGNTMLLWDISFGRAITPDASLILLREFNANPFISDKDNKNALHFLLLKGHDVQRCIIDEVLNHKDIKKHIDDKTIYGDTALHIACARRDEKFITQLLEKGASLEIENINGQTPTDMLHLSEQERLEFLSSEAYLDLSCVADRDLEYLTTIDKEIFNSGPQAIVEKIQEVKEVMIKEKPEVLQNPTLSKPIEQSLSI